jgi:hypothetical protein
MSHFVQGKTTITNQEAIIRALIAKGISRNQIEVHQNAIALRGGIGHQLANIIVPGRVTGHADLGFRKEADGSYTGVFDEYQYYNAKFIPDKAWQKDLFMHANAETVKLAFEDQKIDYSEKMDKDGNIVLSAEIETIEDDRDTISVTL